MSLKSTNMLLLGSEDFAPNCKYVTCITPRVILLYSALFQKINTEFSWMYVKRVFYGPYMKLN